MVDMVLPTKLNKFGFNLALIVLAFVLLISISYIAYAVLFKERGYVGVYFNVNSDMPDPAAVIKYLDESKLPDNLTFSGGINRIEIDKNYSVIFSIKNGKKVGGKYYYTVKSNLFKDSGVIDVDANETKSVVLSLNPSSADKWVLQYKEGFENTNVFDLSLDSWLGVKTMSKTIVSSQGNTSAVIAVDKNINLRGTDQYSYIPVNEDVSGTTLTEQGYAYDPIVLSVDGFGDVLYLNLSLSELRVKPHVKTYSTVEFSEDEKKVEEKIMTLYVSGDKLFLTSRVERQIFKSNPDQLVVYVSEAPLKSLPLSSATPSSFSTELDSEKPYASIGFWYVVK